MIQTGSEMKIEFAPLIPALALVFRSETRYRIGERVESDEASRAAYSINSPLGSGRMS